MPQSSYSPDWSKLKHFGDDTRKSFEELVYVLVEREYGDKGSLTRIDDSGGGDGVEFYLALPGGAVWGWQARFYYPNPRLSVSSRKKHIVDALRRSKKRHPKLKKWFLCTPSRFTPAENTWFKKAVKHTAKKTTVTHWHESKLNELLSKPRNGGLRTYFFGDLELTSDWFAAKSKPRLEHLADRYDSSLHVPNELDAEISALAGDHHYREQLVAGSTELEELASSLSSTRRTIATNKATGVDQERRDALQQIDDVIALVPLATDMLAATATTSKRGLGHPVAESALRDLAAKTKASSDALYDTAQKMRSSRFPLKLAAGKPESRYALTSLTSTAGRRALTRIGS